MTATAKIHQPYELVGRRIGHVTVLQCLGTYNKMKKYLVRCECGNLHTTYGKTLISLGKNNTDYTCDMCRKDKKRLSKMRFLKMIDSKALSAWNYMVKVCYQKEGNINRTICKEWMDFFQFFKDMGEPNDNECLFHIRQFGEYNKKMCRWVDQKKFFANVRYI